MNDFIRLLKAIIALIRSIVQSDLYETPDEVRTAIEKAVKDSGVTSLVARSKRPSKAAISATRRSRRRRPSRLHAGDAAD